MDLEWLAPTITAVGVFIGVIFSGLAALKAAAAKKQSTETHKAVNSRMDELLAIARKLAFKEGQESVKKD